MAGRLSRGQIESRIRQAQQKQRQAINNYNNAARRYNTEVKRVVDDYNRKVRAHNSRLRANQQRLRNELARWSSSSTGKDFIEYRQRVVILRESFARMELSADRGTWSGGDELFDLAEGETANSFSVLHALADASAKPDVEQVFDGLQRTKIGDELASISNDLDARWRGALFSLHPHNPDAARHFCTSAREIISTILDLEAPDEAVARSGLSYENTSDGRITRRSKLRYCLWEAGLLDEEFVDFAEKDIDGIVTLFKDFNNATHGSAGRFNLSQLESLKTRVEDGILFLHKLVRF